MARRYGGKYSPNPSRSGSAGLMRPHEKARVDPAGARANVMFVPAIPMVFLALNAGAVGLTMALVSAAVLTAGAFMLREGLRAEAAFINRKVARRPALPRKTLAACLAGAGIALAAYRNEPGIAAPLLYGLATFGLHVAAFGIDPLRSKGIEGIDSFQQDRVARVVDGAEEILTEMAEAIKRSGDRKMEVRVAQFQTTVRDLIRTVEEDPRDLTAARKYLGIYLIGARDATAKFADIYARSRDAQAREDYAALLDDLEENFAARTQKMLIEDRSDLTIEIDVLRDRLKREGVRLAASQETIN